jgi:hypothetical protein
MAPQLGRLSGAHRIAEALQDVERIYHERYASF